MRVISGQYKGKIIKGFKEKNTRPTMDRIKESLFSMIQTKVNGSQVLDLFAGSGSLGIEALSNSSKSCYFVEKDRKMFLILKSNLKNINPQEKYYLLNCDYLIALKRFAKDKLKFDLVFLDPPYKNNIFINIVLDKLIKYNLLASKGQVVCEYTGEIVINNNYKIIKKRDYKNKKIKIIEKRN